MGENMKKVVSLILAFLISNSIIFMPEIQSLNADSTDCDWTMQGRTTDNCRNVPAECGPKSEISVKLWEFSDGDSFHFPLIVYNFVVCESKKGIICLNLKTGQLIWEREYLNTFKMCIFDNNIIVPVSNNQTVCLDVKTGKELWSNDIISLNNTIYKDGKLFCGNKCIDINTGNAIWEIDADQSIICLPALVDNKLFITSSKSVSCYELNDSAPPRMKWTNKEVQEGRFTTPSVYKNNVYVIAAGYVQTSSCVCSYDANTGKLLWKTNIKKVNDSDLAVNDKYVVVCSGDASLYCINREDGTIKWTLKPNLKINSDQISCTPVIFDKNIIVGPIAGYYYCLNIETGSIIWKEETGYSFSTQPIVSNKRIILTGSKIVCLGDKEDYQPIPFPAKITISPVVKKASTGQQIQFKATVYDKEGKVIESYYIKWSLTGESIIDEYGNFIAIKPGVNKITCKAGEIVSEFLLEVVEPFIISPSSIKFDNVILGETPIAKITISNNMDESLLLNVNPMTNVLSINKHLIALEKATSSEVLITFDSSKTKRGFVGEFYISITCKYKNVLLPVSVAVSQVDPICLKSSLTSLDFGFIKRGTTKTLDFELTASKDITIQLKASESWISLSGDSFKLLKDVPTKISATINASSIPAGESFSAEILASTDDGDCKGLLIPVNVSTDRGIAIGLVVGQKVATINDKKIPLDVPAQIINGRTMVPLRFITEAFGCKVNWVSSEGKITIIRHSMVFYLWKGKNTAVVNGVEQKLDSPPVIIGGRTLVPLRFISEPFGAKVNWEAKTKTITIVWEPN